MRLALVLATRAAGVTGLVVAVLAAATALAQAPTHVPGGSTSQPRAGVTEYVALGDSFTAGPLIPRTDAALGCFRSSRNYPALLADALQVRRLTDVSCSGADTTDMTTRQPTLFASAPPQLSAVSAGTDLVTIGIGGNDFSVFTRLVQGCAAAAAEHPRGHPCRDRHRTPSGRDALLAAASRTGDRLQRVLAKVRQRAPRAQVLVVGYPQVAPVRGTCPAVLPFAAGDYRYADRVERRLNAGLWQAARASGAGYVDTYRASRGHDACAGADAWVNGQRTNTRRAQSYHPFGSYMHAVADLLLRRVLAGAGR